MRIAIVVPVYNEEKFLPLFLKSLEEQSRLPDELVLVDDGSTDTSGEIIRLFSEKHAFCTYTRTKSKQGHAPGAKVVRAFYIGLGTLQKDFDVICKFDADIELPTNYVAELENLFREQQVGMASGVLGIYKGGTWVREGIAKENHVRGPIKAYRKNCFAAIGGLRETIGWDTIDVVLAHIQGFTVVVDSQLFVKHHKPTGAKYSARKGKKMGKAMRIMGYDVLLATIALAKAAWVQKDVKLFWQGLLGFGCRPKHVLEGSERKAIRAWRWKAVLRQIGRMSKKIGF